MQYEYNPKTGENLHFNESNILSGTEHKTIKQCAWICHDKDRYTADDEKAGKGKMDDLKGKHWHIVLNCKPALPLSTIAKWFGVPENCIEFPKGQGAFLDCVEYLTHESTKAQQQGKFRYTDEEVKANFDFRKELDEREENRLKYGKDLSKKDRQRYDVLYHGKTLQQCIDDDKILFMEDIEKLKKFRLEYISNQEAPRTRINYYVCGAGGIGKGLMSRAIARSLFPQYENDDDIYFSVGSGNTTFEGYDGQPVVIWNDCRAIDLIQKLGGRGNVFDVFDTHPPKRPGKQNIKYGSVRLCNVVNIVNSPEDYKDFLDGLAGQYIDKNGRMVYAEDRGQSYRRFPMIIPIRQEDFDILINKGFMENNTDFLQYREYFSIAGNLQKIATICGDNEELAKRITAETVKPIIDKHNEILALTDGYELTEAEILEKFKDYGKIKYSPVILDCELSENNPYIEEPQNRKETQAEEWKQPNVIEICKRMENGDYPF